MTKKQKQSPLAVAIDSTKSDGNTNSNKEVTMSDAASGTVTLTAVEYKTLVAKGEKKASKAQTCTKVWTCIMSKKDIRDSAAPPQMQHIMQAVRAETELHPDVDWHNSDVILDRLLDEDGDTTMTYSKIYRGESEPVKRKRCIGIMLFYAHPDMIEKYDLDRDTYDCK
jgi:hypothetical protein